MRKHAKWWLSGVLVTLLLIIILLPYLMGFWLKREYPDVITRLNHYHHLSVEIRNYHRGWFTSKATLHVTMKSNWLQLPASGLDIIQTIYHGPIVYARWTDGKKYLAFARAVFRNVSYVKQLHFQAVTEWGFNGVLDNHFDIRDLILGGAQQRIHWLGFKGTASFHPANTLLRYHFKIRSGEFSHVGSTHEIKPVLRFEDLESQAEFRQQGVLWSGFRYVGAARMSVYTPKGPLQFSQVTMHTQQRQVAANRTNITMRYHANQVAGAGLFFKPLEASISLNGMDSNALAKLLAKTDSVYGHYSQSQNVALLHNPLLNLAVHGLQLNIKQVILGTPSGRILLNGSLTVPAQTSTFRDGLLSGVLGNLGRLVRRSQLQLFAQAPRLWLEQALVKLMPPKKISAQHALVLSPSTRAKQQLQDWIAANWVTLQGNKVITTLRYANGRFLLNDKELSFKK